MMIQQLIALAIIIIFFAKILKNKKKGLIANNEFLFWTIFWLVAAIAIIFIKQIDSFLFSLGISASGINFIFYLGVLILFYFVFRLRLNIAKLDADLTEMNKHLSIEKAKKENQE